MRVFKLVVLLLLLTATVCFSQQRCYLTTSIICYDQTEQLSNLLKIAVANSQNGPEIVKTQLMAIMFNDVTNGRAIALQPGALVSVLETNPIFTKFSVNGFVYYTLTEAMRCR